MNKALVMDVDQVLLDYSGRLREYANLRYGKSVTGHSETWDLTKWLGVDSPWEASAMIDEFSTSWRFGTLDALPGADVVLHDILRQGYKLICLTACGKDKVTSSLRLANLFHRFGDIFEEVHMIERTDSKRNLLESLSEKYSVKAFFDDKPENITDSAGLHIGKRVLMKSPHNREYRRELETHNPLNVRTAFSWYDCKQIIR